MSHSVNVTRPPVTQLLCSACKNDGSSMRSQTNLLNHPIQSYYLYWTSEATNSSADLKHDNKTWARQQNIDIRIIWGLNGNYIGIIENKMETTF